MAKASGKIPDELKTPNYRITKLEGIGYDKKFALLLNMDCGGISKYIASGLD